MFIIILFYCYYLYFNLCIFILFVKICIYFIFILVGECTWNVYWSVALCIKWLYFYSWNCLLIGVCIWDFVRLLLFASMDCICMYLGNCFLIGECTSNVCWSVSCIWNVFYSVTLSINWLYLYVSKKLLVDWSIYLECLLKCISLHQSIVFVCIH